MIVVSNHLVILWDANTAEAEMRNVKKRFTEYINQTTRCSNDNLEKKK